MKNSFSFFIKKEILTVKLNNDETLSMLNGIFATSSYKDNQMIITINNDEIYSFIKNKLAYLNIIFFQPKSNQLLINKNDVYKKNLLKQQHYFSGVFLASGSISDISSTNYHLEINYLNKDLALEDLVILNEHNLNFKFIERKNKFVLYLKKIENICDFLKAIGTYNAYLTFEEQKIERDFSNNINRLTNFDYYNQERIAKSNANFIENYNYMIEHQLEDLFSNKELTFFKLKINHLDFSLNELKKELEKSNIKKAKPTLSHYINKLQSIVQKYKSKLNKK
ncbi:DNA-binding protein WhiA [Metamycoplasma buccale]|uniref:DNA-binding protein WhiA n=1 Tax=Metamycoplasma buccale TaxID=55602 RepID=UPI00398EA3E0